MAGHDTENPYIPLVTSVDKALVTSVDKALKGLPPLSDSCCIYKVPERLRCVKAKAYTPQVVSIGPIHHGNKGLEDMEEHKKRYLQYFLHRSKVSLEDYVKKIKSKEDELRSCYAHTIEFCTDKFVRIILVDAAFIIELLLRYFSIIEPDSNDRIFYKPRLINDIAPDMLLLENQMPFFILEDLFATGEVPTTNHSLLELSYSFCIKSTSLRVNEDKWKITLRSGPRFIVKHFVDLIRTLHLPAPEKEAENRGQLKSLAIPSMTKLHQAGVKFEVSSSKNLFDICFQDRCSSKNLFDISFQGGTLEIPILQIDDYTEQELRNLIAFEQCHFVCNYFSDYISLMDDLVNTSNDVELLVKNRIVENLLGDNNEVSTLINSLGNGVLVDKSGFYFATLSKALDKYYEKSWNKSKAELRQKYFETPWKTISVIAATFIIILTLIQTVWTVAY